MHKILFIDDDRRQSRPLVRYLELVCGWHVTFVASPDKAIEELRTQPSSYDLILLDVMMPPGSSLSVEDTKGGMDTGFLLLDRIVELMDSRPRVVIYSARRDLETRKRDATKVARWIQKPLTAPEVAAVIREVLQ